MDFACSKRNELFLNLARQYILNKVVRRRTDDKTWYNSELRKLSGKKNNLHCKAKRTNSPADWNSFRMVRNKYTGKMREAVNTYKANIALKLNEGKDKSKILVANCQAVYGKEEMYLYLLNATAFGFWLKIMKRLRNLIMQFLKFATIDTSNASLPDIAYKTNSRLDVTNFTRVETLDILKSLDTSKATGPDRINCKMLKETTIAPSFTRLLPLSLSTATVPSHWKQANVLPIFKKGDQFDFGNHRPLSLLNICSKVCAKIIFKHLYCRDNIISMH